jgi:ribosomal protein S27E
MAFFDTYQKVDVPPTGMFIYMKCKHCQCTTRRYSTLHTDGKRYLDCYWCGNGPVVDSEAEKERMEFWPEEKVKVKS